ncbi:MAG: TolC family protein, partial [Bacteroides ovatus]|nr:TolC family protein [Bacteroides ovatus]
MYLKMYKKYGAVLSSLFLAAQSINAQTDSLFLTIDQLFERGVQHSLQLQADVMKESMAQERIRTARSAQLPELQIGLKGGFVGQPVVWERGLSDPSYPEAPDWSQNYAI